MLAGKDAASRFCHQMVLEHAGQSVWIGDNQAWKGRNMETKNMSNNGLAILSNNYIKHIFCIKVTGLATRALFQQTGGSTGSCISGSGLKQLCHTDIL